MLQEFFDLLLPEGLTVVSTIENGKCRNNVCDSISDMTPQVAIAALKGVDCYFGLGTLKDKFVLKDDGKKGTRVNQNIKELKCFFADIDVDADDPRKYASQFDAINAVDNFSTKYSFPAPMVVSSGGGIHIYWPLTAPVNADKWRQAAKLFKSGLINSGLRIDPTRTADACSILRIPGTKNLKRDTRVEVLRECAPIEAKQFIECMKALPVGNVTASKTIKDTQFSDLKSNLVPVYDPSKMELIVENCAQFAQMLIDGGINEPTWYAGISVARHTTNPDEDAVLISKAHADYDKSATLAKLHQVEKTAVGPTTCAKFNECNPGVCTLCPKWGKITSPIQLGVDRTLPAPVIEIESDDPGVAPLSIELPNPPKPFMRDDGGVYFLREGVRVMVYARDFYPIKRFHDEKISGGITVWRAHLPFEGTVDLQIEQGLLADPKALHKYLLSQHIAVMPGNLKYMVAYMVAYIKQLQDQARTEKLLARLGWRDDNKSFVLGAKVYDSNGSVTTHKMSEHMPKIIPGIQQKGTLQGWKDAIQFYNTEQHEPHRMMLYASFASPIFHMTGHKGALVFASGKSGAGKTTVLRAINSVWGHPEDLLHRASSNGMTENAMCGLFSLYNNLPTCLDEMTNLPHAVFSNTALCISQGQGKLRSTRTGELSKLIESWSLLGFSTSNDDAYMKLLQNRGAAAAEAMRILQLNFPINTRYTKKEADYFANVLLHEHYGHAGHVYIPWVTANYDKIKLSVLKQIDKIGERAKIVSSERFWVGMIGSAATAASIARHNGLLEDFPIEQDITWMIEQLHATRRQISEHAPTPMEVLSEFLESKLNETLVVSSSAKMAEIRVEQAPRGALSIRIDKDDGHAMLMKSQFRNYCAEMGANFSEIQDVLIEAGILLDKNAQRVLGAGTDFGRGQVRCWIIDMIKLGAYN